MMLAWTTAVSVVAMARGGQIAICSEAKTTGTIDGLGCGLQAVREGAEPGQNNGIYEKAWDQTAVIY